MVGFITTVTFQLTKIMVAIFILSAVIYNVQAQDNNNNNIILNGVVTPDFGYGDSEFSYLVTLNFPPNSNPISNDFSIELNIYDGIKRIGGDIRRGTFPGGGLSPQELIAGQSSPFAFGPYNFERDFGLKNVNASYEFVLHTFGKEIKLLKKGPTVEYPHIVGIQYSRQHYYVQEFPIVATYMDKVGISPTAHLEIRGPLSSSEEMTWQTDDVPLSASGTAYKFSANEDFSKYRNGGNFSFKIIYNNAQLPPIEEGPFYFTILPYTPTVNSIEPINVPNQKIEYNNFLINAYVDDAGKIAEGNNIVGSNATIIISHPNKHAVAYTNNTSQPVAVTHGNKDLILFQWSQKDIQFTSDDVNLSKTSPFLARIEYNNDNWKYNATKDSMPFYVVKEKPILILPHYNGIIYIKKGETVTTNIAAIVKYSKGMGNLKINIKGPGINFEDSKNGSIVDTNTYHYDWSIPFSSGQAGNYTIAFTYLHPSLDGGSYEFNEISPMEIVPISIDFQEPNVTPPTGRWDDNFTYSSEVISSVDADTILQIYNPCSSEWENIGNAKKISPGTSNISWQIKPFNYACDELNGYQKYRFKAIYQGSDLTPSRPNQGPNIVNGTPALLSWEYSPIVYVPIGSKAEQTIKATVKYPFSSGQLRLILSGPGMNFSESRQGKALSENSYQYDWNVPFNNSHINHSYTMSLIFSHLSVSGGSFNFGSRSFQVLPIFATPELIFLDYDPVLFVTDKADAYQVIKAIVRYDPGMGKLKLSITGAQKNVQNGVDGADLGGNRYVYKWTVPFTKEQVGNYTLNMTYLHPTLKNGSYSFPDQQMRVVYNNETTAEPELLGDLNYTPVLFVAPDKGANQVFNAEVFSPGGQGVMELNLTGKGKNKQIQMNAKDLGGNTYEYNYTEPFDISNVNNSYRISIDYLLDNERYGFGDHIMQVALIGTNPQIIWEPRLILEYDPTLYVPEGDQADQLIHATINYSSRSGKLKLGLSGPQMSFEEVLAGTNLGENRSRYEATIPFNETHIGNNYTISLTYVHPDLPGGYYRFSDHYMRVLGKSQSAPTPGPTTAPGIARFNVSGVTVIGNVSPSVGIIQAWDEKDSLYALTYTLQLKNWSSQEKPWIELYVKPFGAGQSWRSVGERQMYDPSIGYVSWTTKPFWNTPFFGKAEYKFLINGAETQAFEGPDIVAIYKASDSWTGFTHNYFATLNATKNLTICLSGGDNILPENIKKWTKIGACRDYRAGSGEQLLTWQIANSRPPYFDFDIQIKARIGRDFYEQ